MQELEWTPAEEGELCEHLFPQDTSLDNCALIAGLLEIWYSNEQNCFLAESPYWLGHVRANTIETLIKRSALKRMEGERGLR